MQHFRKILVGVDLSSADRLAAEDLAAPTMEAVNRAIWLAGHSSAELTLMAVLDVSAHTQELLHDEFEEATKSVEAAANEVLQELVAKAKAEGVTASAKIAFGHPWEEMVKAVLTDSFDLVVAGTRNRSRASRLLLGSTGIKLLRTCPCPVWIVKPDPDWNDLNILVASDLTETSEQALQFAVSAAQLCEAKMHVIHAMEDHLGRRMWLTGLPDQQVDSFRQQKRDEAEAQMHEQLSHTDFRTLPFGVKVEVVEGPPDVAILDAIDEHGIDLLVMGTAARSGITGLLIGNTAERLLAHVPCSVLAIKPPGFVCPVKV